MSRKKMLIMDPRDNVGVLLEDAGPGDLCFCGNLECTAKESIAFGHKIALADLPSGTTVLKYRHKIGYATAPISKGTWVHRHNIESERGR